MPETPVPQLCFLVVANLDATFVKDDVEILSELGEVHFWNTSEKGVAAPELMRLCAEVDVIYCWFASFHSFLPTVLGCFFRKPVIVVSGGYDSASVPEIGYGNAGHLFKKYVSGFVINMASAVIVNSVYSAKDMLRFKPAAEPRLHIIPHRINPVFPKPAPDREEKLLLTVARLNPMNYRRKKMELIKRIGDALPEYTIIHIGKVDDELQEQFDKNMPANMSSLGFLSDEELWSWYHRAQALLVPSWHEGFGVTAAEAPAAGCLPFISGAGAQPEVTKGFAVEVKSDEVSDWVKAIQSSLPSTDEAREKMKRAMLDSYTGDVRKNGIMKAIRAVTQL